MAAITLESPDPEDYLERKKSCLKEGMLWESGPQSEANWNSLVRGIAIGALVDFILTQQPLTRHEAEFSSKPIQPMENEPLWG